MVTSSDANALGLIVEAVREQQGGARRADGEIDLAADTRLDELGMDSVEVIEVVGLIEDRIGREFPDEEIARIATIGDLISLIRAK